MTARACAVDDALSRFCRTTMAADEVRSIQVRHFAAARCAEACSLCQACTTSSLQGKDYSSLCSHTTTRFMQLQSMVDLLQGHPSLQLGGTALQRPKRRRANAHNRYHPLKRPRTPAAAQTPMQASANPAVQEGACAGDGDPVSAAPHKRFTNRRMRRRAGATHNVLGVDLVPVSTVMPAQHASCDAAKQLDPEASPSTLRGAPQTAAQRRLPTHAWHATRFAMREQHGWQLPEHASGKGHRGRSLIRALHNRTVLHDASYRADVRIVGSVEGVRAMFEVLVRKQSAPDAHAGVQTEHTLHTFGDAAAAWDLLDAETGTVLGPCQAVLIPLGSADADSHAEACITVHPLLADAALRSAQFACARAQQKVGDAADAQIGPGTCLSVTVIT